MLSAICKEEADIEDADEDEEDPQLDYNEEYIDGQWILLVYGNLKNIII